MWRQMRIMGITEAQGYMIIAALFEIVGALYQNKSFISFLFMVVSVIWMIAFLVNLKRK